MIGLLAWLALTPPLAIVQEGPTEPRVEQDEIEFPKLKSPARRKAEAALLTLRRGKTRNDLEKAVKILKQTGVGAIPMVLMGWRRFEPDPEAEEPEEDRRYLLESILEEILSGDYLHLAWEEMDKRTPDSARIYLTRRWADSNREDAGTFLHKQLGQSRGRVNYESARGLAWRGLDAALTPLHSWMKENWSESMSALRADFKGVERGPLSAGCLALMDSQD
ncbi:MAG TPA: hypothetical protein DDW23_05700, partial [Planctomycetes bacterium]|nr:hypothetical protein [Planctomycetota bacterium]